MSLRARLAAAQRQLGGQQGPVQFWVLAGDGFARCGDQVLSEEEFRRLHGDGPSFTLVLGDHSPSEVA
jgi:hypothetical protein